MASRFTRHRPSLLTLAVQFGTSPAVNLPQNQRPLPFRQLQEKLTGLLRAMSATLLVGVRWAIDHQLGLWWCTETLDGTSHAGEFDPVKISMVRLPEPPGARYTEHIPR